MPLFLSVLSVLFVRGQEWPVLNAAFAGKRTVGAGADTFTSNPVRWSRFSVRIVHGAAGRRYSLRLLTKGE